MLPPSMAAPVSSNITDVVDDLLMEIFIRLPVLSLLRFKSVCKSWHALITAPYFIHRHATLEDKLETFIFQYGPIYHKKKGPASYTIINTRDHRFLLLSGNQFEVFKDLGAPPLHKRPCHLKMVGSCHGIICLHDVGFGDVYLWNPATKQFRLLPESLTPPLPDGGFDVRRNGHFKSKFAAFGFDIRAKDYKVLKFTSFSWPQEYPSEGYCYTCQLQVYSLNTDSWRFIDVDPRIRIHGNNFGYVNGRYLNGKYFFKGFNFEYKQKGREMILSYDFSQETFLPQSGVVEIWELNECCGKESARRTKRYTITRPMSAQKCWMVISKNGEFGIAEDFETIKIHNLVTQEVKDSQFAGNGKMTVWMSDVYKESLVSVGRNGLSCDDNNKYNLKNVSKKEG